MDTIYLDHNATSPIHREVVEAMARCYAQGYANPASQHRPASRPAAFSRPPASKSPRVLGADLAAPRRDRLIFTSGGTEANNLAILGMAAAGGGPPAEAEPEQDHRLAWANIAGEHRVSSSRPNACWSRLAAGHLGARSGGTLSASEQLPPLLDGPATGPAGTRRAW